MKPNEPGTVKVLLVEDDEEDYLITRDMMRRQNRTRFALDWCSDYETALAAIGEQKHDVYLIDYRLGRHTGLDLVRAGFAGRSGAPVIILTSQTEYEIDLEATGLGVTDFLLKQELNPLSLERSIRYAISHHQALQELARTQERYTLAARAVNDGIWDWDLDATSCTSRPVGVLSSDCRRLRHTNPPRLGSSSSTRTTCPGCGQRYSPT